MFSLYFVYVYFSYSRFGSEGWIWVLIVSVPDLCMLFTVLSLEKMTQSVRSGDTPLD